MQPNSPVRVVIQDYKKAVFPWLTVKENIKIGQRKLGTSLDWDSVLDISNIDHSMLNRYPSELSGGQVQRVQLARALYSNCEFLILDEPTSSQDMEFRNTILESIRKITDGTDIGVLLITHNIEEAVYASKRVLVVNKDEKSNLSLVEKEGFGFEVTPLPSAIETSNFQNYYSAVYDEIFK